jgi:hypothetical protein
MHIHQENTKKSHRSEQIWADHAQIGVEARRRRGSAVAGRSAMRRPAAQIRPAARWPAAASRCRSRRPAAGRWRPRSARGGRRRGGRGAARGGRRRSGGGPDPHGQDPVEAAGGGAVAAQICSLRPAARRPAAGWSGVGVGGGGE